MKKLIYLFLISLFTACSVKLIAPSQSDVDRVSVKYPGYSLAELNDGKALFQQTCTKCHRLKDPASRNEEKWKKIVPKMMAKLNKKEGKQVLDDKQQESILKYIITMNLAAKSTK
jgi:cytochrome c5